MGPLPHTPWDPNAQVLLAAKADWGGIKWVEFQPDGTLVTPWGKGKWGLAQKPKGLQVCAPPNECLFADFSGGAHTLHFELPDKFYSTRVGDGEQVTGARING